jgi:phosphomevalonate kinase
MVLEPKKPSNEAGQAARQQYLDLAKRVTGEANLDYDTLYQRFAENDWAAVKLDDAISSLSLKTGNSAKQTVGILHQSPYLQHQVHHRNVPLAPMSQYVRSTVLKSVQQLKQTQSLTSETQSRSTSRKSELEKD